MRPRGRTLGRVVRLGFVVLVAVLLVRELRAQGAQVGDALARTPLAVVGASLLAVLAGLLASALVWRALLADLGTRLPLRPALHVFFLGQLGKYVPGNVFAIAAQMELGRGLGAPRTRVATASLLFMGVLVAAGLLVAAVALPLTSPRALRDHAWVLALLPVGLVCLAPPVLNRAVGLALRLLRRPPLERPLSAAGVGTALGWALVMWAAYGVHLLLLVLPQQEQGSASLPLLAVGGYALAWTAGFLFVVAPAGLGVRELALAAALSPVLDRPGALAVAAVSRLVMTVGDLVWGVAGGALRPRVVASRTVQQQGKAADA